MLNTLKVFYQTHGSDPIYWLAYSGGLDSHVLLHLFAQLRAEDVPLKLHAVHIHHGLSPHANEWVKHCAAVCQNLQVPFSHYSIDAVASVGQSPEEVARKRRYAVLAELLAPQDVLLTAHHQDDQAETVLLQLLRGAGPKGLAAMPSIKSFAKGFHARPLLQLTRADLKKYAEQHQLHWIEDESNVNLDFSRNFLRHEVLPMLQKRWPSVTKTLSRTAENCAEAQQLLDELAQQDLVVVKGSQPATLSIKKLSMLDAVRQRHVLRVWLNQMNFPIPSAIRLKQIQHDMLQARGDKSPYFAWQGFELRRYQDDLYAMPALLPHDTTQVFAWDGLQPLLLPNSGRLHARENGNFSVRFRQGGEVLTIPERGGHHVLKKLFQEWQVPPWERDRIPLIFKNNLLIAVVGYTACDQFKIDIVSQSPLHSNSISLG